MDKIDLYIKRRKQRLVEKNKDKQFEPNNPLIEKGKLNTKYIVASLNDATESINAGVFFLLDLKFNKIRRAKEIQSRITSATKLWMEANFDKQTAEDEYKDITWFLYQFFMKASQGNTEDFF
jgi:hypothetical protein